MSQVLKKWEMVVVITVRRQVGKALVLTPLPLAIADVEINLHWAGYSLVLVGRDLHDKRTLS